MTTGLFSLPMPAVADPQTAAGSFVVGPENALVQALAEAVTRERAAYNPLVLCGPSGVGKTTLAHVLADRRTSALNLAHPLAITAADLARSLAHAAETNSVADLRTRHHRCDLLLIDDVHQLAGRPAAQQFLVTTLDVLVRRGVQVIATLRQLPGATDELLPGLASRLNAGLIVPLAPPAGPARREIVRQLAQRLDLRLTDEMLNDLSAAKGRRNAALTVPHLRSTLLQLASATEHGRQPLRPALVSQVLDGDEPEAKAVVRQIAAAVAQHFGLTVTKLKSKSRHQTTAHARGLAMYLSRELTDLTLADIGKLFGGRDHSTVLHACRKMASLVRTDPSAVRLAQELSSQINAQVA